MVYYIIYCLQALPGSVLTGPTLFKQVMTVVPADEVNEQGVRDSGLILTLNSPHTPNVHYIQCCILRICYRSHCKVITV